MTTSPVTTLTDELIAELELCESCDCGFDMDSADVKAALSELRRLRAENAGLAQSLAESRANDQAAMGWLTSLRWASGDRGERMLPELVTHIEELKRDAERYRWLIKCTGSSIAHLTLGSSLFSDEDIDNAIDTAMSTAK